MFVGGVLAAILDNTIPGKLQINTTKTLSSNAVYTEKTKAVIAMPA